MKYLVYTCFLCIMSLPVYGQINSNSIYSAFGLGVPTTKAPGFLNGMAGAGTALRPEFNLNTKNPAAQNAIASPFTMMLTAGMDLSFNQFSDDDQDGFNIGGGLSHLDLWFRLSPKWTANLGLQPFSVVNYNVLSQEFDPVTGSEYTVSDQGEGGINQFRISQAVTLFNRLHLGFNGLVYFGTITETELVRGLDAIGNFAVVTQNAVSDLNYELGMQYVQPIPAANIIIGATYQPGKVLNSVQDYQLETGREILEGDLSSEVLALPEELQTGLAFQNKNWSIAVDGKYVQWSELNQYLDRQSSYRYQDVYGASIGLSYAKFPFKNDMSLKATHYRLGFSIENSYLEQGGNDFLAWKVSAGVGLPITQGRKQVNLNYQYSHQGRTLGNLIRETAHTLTVSFSLRDVWFKQRKFN
ncbi:MAG: hypothetical protein AAF242_05185 [Bacteroidota bacterium]